MERDEERINNFSIQNIPPPSPPLCRALRLDRPVHWLTMTPIFAIKFILREEVRRCKASILEWHLAFWRPLNIMDSPSAICLVNFHRMMSRECPVRWKCKMPCRRWERHKKEGWVMPWNSGRGYRFVASWKFEASASKVEQSTLSLSMRFPFYLSF